MSPSEVLGWSSLDIAIAVEAIRAGTAEAGMVSKKHGAMPVIVMGEL